MVESKIKVTLVSKRHNDTLTVPIYRMKSIYGQLKLQIPFADVPTPQSLSKFCSFVQIKRVNSGNTEVTIVLGDDTTILIEPV